MVDDIKLLEEASQHVGDIKSYFQEFIVSVYVG